MNLTRRGFLAALGVGVAAIVVPELVVEPRRRFWQVSRSAPVGLRRVGSQDITFNLPDANGPIWQWRRWPDDFDQVADGT